MAKKKLDKTSMYMLAIVGIVAVVGIAVLILNTGLSTDMAGQASAIEVIKGDEEIKGIEPIKGIMPFSVLTVDDLTEGMYYTVKVSGGMLIVEEIKDRDFNIKGITNIKGIKSIKGIEVGPNDLVVRLTYVAFVEDEKLNIQCCK